MSQDSQSATAQVPTARRHPTLAAPTPADARPLTAAGLATLAGVGAVLAAAAAAPAVAVGGAAVAALLVAVVLAGRDAGGSANADARSDRASAGTDVAPAAD